MNWLLKVGMAVVAAGFAAAPNSLMAAEKNATPKDKAAAAIESISHDTGGWETVRPLADGEGRG